MRRPKTPTSVDALIMLQARRVAWLERQARTLRAALKTTLAEIRAAKREMRQTIAGRPSKRAADDERDFHESGAASKIFGIPPGEK